MGERVEGDVDWPSRYALMRTHTALHILCGVIWNEYGKAVTGGNMEPLTARMDFEFDPLPEGFAATMERGSTRRSHWIDPSSSRSLPREAVFSDEDLIRTKTNLVPEHVTGGPDRGHRGARQAGGRRHARALDG